MRLISVFLALAVGACIYLFLLNRYLLLMTDGGLKLPISRGTMVMIGLGSAAFGYWAAGTLWMLVPVVVLAAAGAGELRRWLIRRRTRGAPPVESINHGVTWNKPNTTTDLAVLRYELPIRGWRGPDLRIVHVSDLHVDGNLPESYYSDTLARVAEAAPDLLIYTGDFVRKAQDAVALPDVLSSVKGRLGTLAVLGNHDYWSDAGRVADAVQSAGVTWLGNGNRRISIGGHTLLVGGYEGPWSTAPWTPPQVSPGELALMLTHTPDNIYRLSRLGFAAVFAGHYHAGQLRLPWIGSLVIPSRLGRRFDHGHFVVNDTHLFVSAGVGSAEPPVRLYCQPDVFVVDVKGV